MSNWIKWLVQFLLCHLQFHYHSDRSDISQGNMEGDITLNHLEVFAGENCATPTPGDVTPRGGTDSGTSTPRCLGSPSVDISPLAAHLLKAERQGESPSSDKQTKIQSSSISHALHSAHTTTTNTSNSNNTESDCSTPSEPRAEYTKLSIAPLDSPIAAATSRVVSILANSQQNPKLPNTSNTTHMISSSADTSPTPLNDSNPSEVVISIRKESLDCFDSSDSPACLEQGSEMWYVSVFSIH